jgi:hypothetical protein
MPRFSLGAFAVIATIVGAMSLQSVPRFEPVQPEMFTTGGALVNAWADYDRDGDLDLFVAFNGRMPNRLYRNHRGVFTEVAADAGIADGRPTRAAAWGDIDNDGEPDLIVGFAPGTGSVLRLYRNIAAKFVDVTGSAGLHVETGAVRQLAWIDFDGDGDLDLFVAFRDRPNALYLNELDELGRFRDVARERGLVDSLRSVGAVWFDIDEDGDLDLVVANMDGDPNTVYRNDRESFSRCVWLPADSAPVARERGVCAFARNGSETRSELQWGGRAPHDSSNGTVRPCAADVDGDGRVDLFFANYGPNGLFLNRGNLRFDDVSAEWNVAVDGHYDACAFADFDNDGKLDLYVNGTVTGGRSYPDYLFRNSGTALVDITPAGVRALEADHGVQWADFDQDGAIDIALTGSAPNAMHALLRNMLARASAERSLSVLVLDAEGHATHAGAEVRLFTAGTRHLIGTRLVDSGSGYDAQSAGPVHFGLPVNTRVDIEVIVPNGDPRRPVTRVERVDPRAYRGGSVIVRTSPR